ncbi:hypothetical protein M422DRAFT_65124 [Sphaerobolus stellatus SS14]|nr:hypothetical protein M422DRAFT_65124 [Sphaerobolus stellatus SS14]
MSEEPYQEYSKTCRAWLFGCDYLIRKRLVTISRSLGCVFINLSNISLSLYGSHGNGGWPSFFRALTLSNPGLQSLHLVGIATSDLGIPDMTVVLSDSHWLQLVRFSVQGRIRLYPDNMETDEQERLIGRFLSLECITQGAGHPAVDSYLTPHGILGILKHVGSSLRTLAVPPEFYPKLNGLPAACPSLERLCFIYSGYRLQTMPLNIAKRRSRAVSKLQKLTHLGGFLASIDMKHETFDKLLQDLATSTELRFIEIFDTLSECPQWIEVERNKNSVMLDGIVSKLKRTYITRLREICWLVWESSYQMELD